MNSQKEKGALSGALSFYRDALPPDQPRLMSESESTVLL